MIKEGRVDGIKAELVGWVCGCYTIKLKDRTGTQLCVTVDQMNRIMGSVGKNIVESLKNEALDVF
jgi:hypothetical protein